MSSAESDGNRQSGLIALCVLMLILAVVSIALRCWSIWGSPNRKFGYDDAFAILTLPFIIAEFALAFYWISLGLGRHSATLPISNQLAGPKLIFAAAYLYDLCITLPKLSVLCFYYRVLRRGATWVIPTLWAVGALCVCWLIGSGLLTTFQCTPINAAWQAVPGARCFTQWKFFTGTAAPSAILDLIILLIPLPLLWSLHMSKAKKAMLIGLFICGYSVVILSIGRLITLLMGGSALEEDLTWSTIRYICWVQCEGPISLMSVCLPNIMELARRLRNKNKQPTTSALSLSRSKQTASELLSGNRSFHPFEEDREAAPMDQYSGNPNRNHIKSTIEATRPVSERDIA
ncbi:uncharacterized protein N7487_002932 [Penicillium crustosum]|uniref:uncharacterized protein n=1 Tax=Penicillium crustosum TaxID=36656 RepID=UPI00239A19DC|nr:uncharacterized protein N7487_002932 [Penicillium crustosum]KAJ5419382.1 hypothetical protein N7487_002932 [Penicillium crustosum]